MHLYLSKIETIYLNVITHNIYNGIVLFWVLSFLNQKIKTL